MLGFKWACKKGKPVTTADRYRPYFVGFPKLGAFSTLSEREEAGLGIFIIFSSCNSTAVPLQIEVKLSSKTY